MRIAKLTLIGSIAALAIAAAPGLAKNTAPPQKPEDQSASCHSYLMAPDGSWTVLPCHEAGPTEHKPPSKAAEQEPR